MRLGDTLEIRELESQDEQQAIDAHHQLIAEDFEFLPTWSADEDWEDYIYRMSAGRRGEHIPEGWVRSGLFAAFDQGDLVGRVSLRYELNEGLLQVGGHIGYGVIPEYRRLGVARALCKFGLQELREAEIEHALVTCDSDNIASKSTIESCGGLLDAELPEIEVSDGPSKLRFWIPTRSIR